MHSGRRERVEARKKLVFVIVEGPSDAEALGLLLEQLFDTNRVYVHIVYGDITSERGVTARTIRSKLGQILRFYMRSNHLSPQHFQEIIHLVDTDGVYIPNCNVVEDKNAQHPWYSAWEIRTANRESIIDRNLTKSGCLNKISETPTICNIPYQVYYMSCNLDHVLYNVLNATDEEKERYSLAFAKKFKTDFLGFIKFISESKFSINKGYLDSWDFIKQDCHSLERYTNLGICIARARNNQIANITS